MVLSHPIRVLAIVGSQKWPAGDEFNAKILIATAVTLLEPVLIISGGCKTGVDSWVEQEWMERAAGDAPFVPGFKEYLPGIHQWDPADGSVGYKKRNMAIAENCDALMCIRSTGSTTYGSGWTADYAEQIGKKVWRFHL